MNIIQTLEAERMTRKVPDFKPGDTVVVQVKVVEGDRERVQAYEGVVIAHLQPRLQLLVHGAQGLARRGRRAHVPDSQPAHQRDRVKRRGNVRRAKLYYLRDRAGKSARIEEKV